MAKALETPIEETPNQNSLDLALKQLQLEQLLEAKRAKEILAQERENQKSIIREQTKAEREHRELSVRSCSHLKKNGETYVSGQRDHKGGFLFICQRCLGQFTMKNLPPAVHSVIDMDTIGGPA